MCVCVCVCFSLSLSLSLSACLCVFEREIKMFPKWVDGRNGTDVYLAEDQPRILVTCRRASD